jgi:pimeloyl-ACP methyl ester carboxylesterase
MVNEESSAMADDAYPHDGMVAGAGVMLHFRDWGGPPTAPALLLLHGLASSARIWDLVAPLLARYRRVVALDQRGHGLSEKPDTGYDFATVIADDLATAKSLGLGARYAVAGHSWGANVALEFAAGHPESVVSVLLVDGGFGMLRQRPGASWEQISRDLAPPEFAGTPAETFVGWMRAHNPNWRSELEEIALNIVELRADGTVGPRLSRANHMRILRAMWDEDPTLIYPAVQAPVLYVLAEPPPASGAQGSGHATLKRQGIMQATKLLVSAPQVTVDWMPDTIHDIPLQRPEELARRMEAFLAANI